MIPTIKSSFGTLELEVALANTKSAKKRILQNEKRRIRNREVLSRTRTYVKRARVEISEGDYPSAEIAVRQAISQLDRATAKGVIHKNNAARSKSRLMAHLNQLQADEVPDN
jgi:small subunit ribosomal protein S20